MLAERVDYVIGVDTHRDQHTLAVVVAPIGAVVAQQSVGASARGYAEGCASRSGTPSAMTFRYTDVWVREGTGWRLATRHASGVRSR
jgi:transposase